MSGYYRDSKHKSSRSSKEEETKSRTRNSRHKEDSRHSKIESKTPPLPVRRTSIEELINRRESLKKELKKISQYSDSNLGAKYNSNKSDKNRKHSKNDFTHNSYSRKRRNDGNEDKRKPSVRESSPEHNGDYAQLESEDEESIIEKRRQQRKELLKKLNVTHKDSNRGENEHTESKSVNHASDKDNISHTQINSSVGDITDMFSEKDDFVLKSVSDHVTQDNIEENAQLTDNWDDPEGYYNVRVGDEINNNRYTIKSILGKGVFANVVRAQDNDRENTDVAVKIIRNNELMYKTGLKEIAVLKEIINADPENKYHCVKLLRHFMHKGHLCLVLESLYMDLRCVLKKYGKHGINMKALMSYSRQLLLSLRLLKKIGIVHADVKPDNILVNEKKNILKLCDFGSAAKVDDNEPTPYLVSRFYRAPEIILGIPYKHSVDVWSAACTMYEMATGKIMFAGSSNNKMLKCFMDLKGKFSTRLIRKGRFKDQHFNYNNNFLLHKKDEFSGREKYVEMNNIIISRDLMKDLTKSCKKLTGDDDKKLLQFKDVIEKMVVLDPGQRLPVTDCLKHPFILEELRK